MKFSLALVGLVLHVHNVWSHCPCLDNNCGLSENTDIGGEYNGDCIPLVVRPQAVPKPAVALPLNLGIVPGPCTYKKAIVRPAIVPKPVCEKQILPASFGFAGSALYKEGNFNGVKGFLNAFNGASGNQVSVGGRFGTGFEGCSPLGAAIQGVGIGDYRVGTPADPVSISIALKKQAEIENCERAIEDKLSFGFRKIPIELPKKERAAKAALIPEENIHRLNGKIVEFIPPKPGCKRRTLEEEAVEDLLELEAEEAVAAEESRRGPYSNILLEEIGYRPASLRSGNFLDVAADVVNQAANAVAGAAGGGTGSVSGVVDGAVEEMVDAIAGAVAGAAGAAAGAASGIFGNNGYLPGNVEYRTLPQVPDAIIFPTPEIPDSCESGEIIVGGIPKLNTNNVKSCLKFNQQAISQKSHSQNNVFLQQMHM